MGSPQSVQLRWRRGWAGMGGDDTHNQHTSIPVSTHLRIIHARGTPGARITDVRRVVRTLRALLHGGRLLLTSAANAQQQQHTSAAVYVRALLHSCVHAIRVLTRFAVAVLPLCVARQFEVVRQSGRAASPSAKKLLRTGCRHHSYNQVTKTISVWKQAKRNRMAVLCLLADLWLLRTSIMQSA